jgi:hypothetical protein
MIPVMVVQTPIHQVINVVTMRDFFVTFSLVIDRAVHRLAISRICRRHLNLAFVIMPVVFAVKMAIVNKVYVVVMLNLGMAATVFMFVVVLGMIFTIHNTLLGSNPNSSTLPHRGNP